MTPEEFAKLDLKVGAHVVVTWFDAAEVHIRTFRMLTEDEAITLVQTEGQFVGTYQSPNYPDLIHVLVYEGKKSVYVPSAQRTEVRHVIISIPLPLIKEIMVTKRPRRATKIPSVYVVEIGEAVKRVIREKEVERRRERR
jgi:hypothetical protein